MSWCGAIAVGAFNQPSCSVRSGYGGFSLDREMAEHTHDNPPERHECRMDPGHEGPCKFQKRRGRPPGVPNSYPVTHNRSMTGGGPREVPPSASRHDDFAHADPATMLSRQLSMISWQQQALRIKIMGGIKSEKDALADIRKGGMTTFADDTKELLDLSNALVRAIDGMKKHMDMAKELAAQMNAEELLEAALKKIEGQSIATLNYAIKRLRAKREALAPVPGFDRHAIGYPVEDPKDQKATDAIAELMKS